MSYPTKSTDHFIARQIAALQKIMAVAFLSLFALTLAFAEKTDDNTGRDDTQVYHIFKNVDLVNTMRTRTTKNPKVFIKAVYPQLESDDENISVVRFNEQVLALLEQEITIFQNNVTQTYKTLPPKLAGKTNNLYIDYATSVVKSGEDYLISIRFSLQSYVTGMAHPLHYHRVMNYSIDNNQEISLAELFQPESNYLMVLSDYSRKILAKRLRDSALIHQGTIATAENFRNWNIKPNGLLITFDDAQVAPYVYGTQTVLIPYAALKEILATDSPLSACIASRKKCMRNNVLTGGFIDTAINTQHGRLNPMLSKI